jgi:membrane-bound lytic murein transglycosylase D
LILARRLVVTVVIAGSLSACGGATPPPALPTPAPTPDAAADARATAVAKPGGPRPVEPPHEAIAPIIESSEQHFVLGQQALQQGHLTSARAEFDAAVDVLIRAPGGARGVPELQAQYERLLDRISALEMTALRQGDGFTETRSEPAAIDTLLAATATFPQPAPAPTTREQVTADLAITPHDIPIAVNEKVLAFVETFQGDLRQFLEDGLKRGSRYLPMIEDVFRSEGVPVDLAYVPLIESAFKPTALSRASARGMWQFEGDTAKEQGLKLDWFVDERADPEKATRAAAQYFKVLYDMFGQDWNVALAAYNAGMGTVDHAMKRAGTQDFWKLTESTRYLPRATCEYVPMILASILIARNPAAYGFDIGEVEPLAYDKVLVPDALDLRLIAEWTGSTIEEIRDLNPELRRTVTPIGAHDVKVPVGKGAALEARLTTADPKQFTDFDRHTVKKGETIQGIARQFKVKSADLAGANQLKTTSKLQAGQTLLIPWLPSGALTSRPAAPITTPATTTASKTPAKTPASTTAKTTAPASKTSTVTYKVKAGDTLSGIARQFDTTVQQIKTWNQLTSDALSVGEKLTIHQH